MRQIDAALNHLILGRYHHFCAIKFMTTIFTVLTQLTLRRKMYLKRQNKLALEADVFEHTETCDIHGEEEDWQSVHRPADMI